MGSFELPHLLFYLGEEIYGISVEYVHEMLLTPKITILPDAAMDVRGVVNLRGTVVKIIDLGRRLGMQPLEEELKAFDRMLQQRKKEHIEWLNELEACIHEKREFRLATNPHECKFGRWYDGFKTNNALLAKYLPRFEEPHKAIHATASEALAKLSKGHTDQALKIIEDRRKAELSEMLKLFENIMSVLRESNTEITVVLASDGKPVAVTVDRVFSVEHLPVETLQDPPEIIHDLGIISKIGRRKSGELVAVIDSNYLIE